MSRLEINLLGPFEVSQGSEPITGFESNKVRALLAYLAVENGQPHTRGALAGLLWPEEAENVARQNLSRALYSLRRSLGGKDAGEALLLADAQSIRLQPGGPWAVDVVGFRDLIARCEAHHHRRWRTCTACAKRLRQATRAYRGDLLQQFSLGDSVPFEEWTLARREVLRQAALSACERLVEYCEWHGAWDEAIEHARRQLELDPLREEAHRQVMRLLAATGQRAAALAQYDHCRRLLAADLGVEPEPATRELGDQIRAAGEPRRFASFEPPPANLPVPPTSLIGRAGDLEELKNLLLDDGVRLVTVTGSPGIGKTRLALQAAWEMRFDFDDGVHFVALAPIWEPERVVSAIAQALPIHPSGGQPIAGALVNWLRDRHLLLLLDNFEQVLDAAPQVADLLAACPSVKILVTSRAALRLRTERLVQSRPLALPDASWPGRPAALANVPSVALFLERAQAVMSDFRLDDANAAAIADICVRLDGLPLAIELIAARLDAMPIEELAARLDDRLAVLQDGPRDLPARQQTLRAALEWSEALLSDGERELLAELGVFVGGATLPAIRAVADAAAPGQLDVQLAGLVHKSLVQAAGSPMRYTMLQTVREFALERLAARGDLARCWQRHAAYFLGFAEQNSDTWESPRQPEFMQALEGEQANLRAALDWAGRAGEVELALRLAGALWRFWDLHGDLAEGLRWLDFTLKNSGALGPAWRMARAIAAQGAAQLAEHADDVARAAHYLEQALDLYQQLDKAAEVAAVLNDLGWLAQRRGDFEKATDNYEASLRQYEVLGDDLRAAWTLGNLALVAFERGELDEARALAEQVRATMQRLKYPASVLVAWVNLGEIYRCQGDQAAAEAAAEQALRLGEQTGIRLYAAMALLTIASVRLEQGRYAEAHTSFEQALSRAREVSNRQGQFEALNGLAAVALARGELTTAQADLDASLPFLSDPRHRGQTAQLLRSVAGWCAQRGRRKRAARLLAAEAALRGPAPLSPASRASLEQLRRLVLARLGDPTFAGLWGGGQVLTLEQALVEAGECLAQA